MISKKNICLNCGFYGHIYKNCNHPITSYGIICYKIINDNVFFLMVQRRNSFSYVEFIRGKYYLENLSYLKKLFSGMTQSEKEFIKNKSFEELWKNLWIDESLKNFNNEFYKTQEKFNKLKEGYNLRINETEQIEFITLENILKNTNAIPDCEWGFPKGRRDQNENDFICALREFSEETGINSSHIEICFKNKTFEEIYTGTNTKRYKNIYYVASLLKEYQTNIISCHEIKSCQWFDINTVLEKIGNHNIERKELITRIYNLIIKKN